jgi:hypothetical protein
MTRTDKKQTQKATAAPQPDALTPPAEKAPKAPPPPVVPLVNPSPKVILNSVKTQVLSRAAYRTGTGWLHSPARLQLLTVAARNLVSVARDRGMDVGEVLYARAARLEGQHATYVYPTDDQDPDRLEVTKQDSGVWINLRTLLAPADLLVAPGTSVRYDITVAGAESPVGPALVFDRSVEKARKITVTKKKANPTSDGTDPKPNKA